MILIGQYDSPFVRRVAIALRLYGIGFEQRPWSTFGDADKIAPYNPLRRVPTLVLDNGEAVIESTAILDHLDELVGPEAAMMAERGDLRRRAFPARTETTAGASERHRRRAAHAATAGQDAGSLNNPHRASFGSRRANH